MRSHSQANETTGVLEQAVPTSCEDRGASDLTAEGENQAGEKREKAADVHDAGGRNCTVYVLNSRKMEDRTFESSDSKG